MSEDESRLGARQNYDRLSRWYDFFSGRERRLALIGLRRLDLRAGEQVLEIGFGTGHTLVEMARAVIGSGHVYGIDLSPGMLGMAEKNIQHTSMIKNITVRLGDATCLPFLDDMFDAVFMSFTLELFTISEIPIVLKECWRVLKPGGRLGIVSLSKRETFSIKVYEWFHAILPTLVDCRPIFLGTVLSTAGYILDDTVSQTLWGLPVEIVVARRG